MARTERVVQYVCSECLSLLKECPREYVSIDRISEDCPNCGCSLSQSVEVHRSKQQIIRPQLQLASSISVLMFDIKALDDFFLGLRSGDSLCITGPQAGLIVNRLCVRTLLPSRYGGLGSSVLFLDGGNNSDIYQCVNFARQYGLDIKKVLDGIVVSRAFTIHQLAELVVDELPKAIQKFGTKMVVISGLLTMFLQDPAIDQKEAKHLLRVILAAIKKILAEVIMIVTLKEASTYGEMIHCFDNLIEISNSADSFTIQAYKNGRKTAFPLLEKELQLVATR